MKHMNAIISTQLLCNQMHQHQLRRLLQLRIQATQEEILNLNHHSQRPSILQLELRLGISAHHNQKPNKPLQELKLARLALLNQKPCTPLLEPALARSAPLNQKPCTLQPVPASERSVLLNHLLRKLQLEEVLARSAPLSQQLNILPRLKHKNLLPLKHRKL